MKPIVWTIAGSDSGGGAGIQADLATFQDFSVHGCSVVTAVTAQNSVTVDHIAYVSPESVQAQLAALQHDLPAQVIKIGMLGNREVIQSVAEFLRGYAGFVVCDPVMMSSSGRCLLDPSAQAVFKQLILPRVDLLTPNRDETQALLGRELHSPGDITRAAREILSFGVKSVLIKGGHHQSDFCHDYWTDGDRQFWLSQHKQQHDNTHGSGCTLSAAIVAVLARAYVLEDALTLAKMYVTQGIRCAEQIGQGPGPVSHCGWPQQEVDLPWLTPEFTANRPTATFAALAEPIGLYPLVDSAVWVERCLQQGVRTIQLRIKDKSGAALLQEVRQSIAVARRYDVQLFINDDWQLAIAEQAYGVHLGQDDLIGADLEVIAKAGLRLGVSTHGHAQVARAYAIQPSYIAIGPVFKTRSKQIAKPPQGLTQLHHWCQLLSYPLVAIGGINLKNAADVLQTGVGGIAVISAVTRADDPEAAMKAFLQLCV
ncbi:MAG: bifunctional hydroxymethylpyrimidine kinase/phosphomethylpyrimidine kinase [Gammaproteobacteria bacterium]